MNPKFKILNSNHLKMIAIIAMTIDHIADLLFPNFPAAPLPIILHLIGRLTAPIMWFFICEGFFYTKNIKKYILRMAILAVISHFAYCFAFGIGYIPFSNGKIFNQTSVIYPLLIALIVLFLRYKNTTMKTWLKKVLEFILIFSAFPADWASIATLAILDMYKNRTKLLKQMVGMMFYVVIYAIIAFFFVNKVYAILTIGVILVYPLLLLYNGQKGKAGWMKWLFYAYYPAHLIIIGIIKTLIYGNTLLLF